ncbi:MAG: hypothetical protein HFJ28_04795 [Clostridia bacterium]|nr:hypothetical protein [Clostridia bacterium]
MFKAWKAVVSALSVVAIVLLYYFMQPTLSIMFADGFLFIFIALLIIAANTAMWLFNPEKGEFK